MFKVLFFLTLLVPTTLFSQWTNDSVKVAKIDIEVLTESTHDFDTIYQTKMMEFQKQFKQSDLFLYCQEMSEKEQAAMDESEMERANYAFRMLNDEINAAPIEIVQSIVREDAHNKAVFDSLLKSEGFVDILFYVGMEKQYYGSYLEDKGITSVVIEDERRYKLKEITDAIQKQKKQEESGKESLIDYALEARIVDEKDYSGYIIKSYMELAEDITELFVSE